ARRRMAHRAGYAAIVGRPNVGKSTLLNALVGAKVAIVTPKPQTTRNRILGIRTLPEAQVVFLDTPGIHEARSLLNRRMVEVARQALDDADVVVLVVDATAGVTPADRELARGLGALARPTVVVLSKLDLVRPPVLLPAMEALGTLLPGREIIPVGARTGENVRVVLDAVVKALPEGPRLYPEDEYTAESERFLAQELIREQLFSQTEEEIPYGTAVRVEEFRAQRAIVDNAPGVTRDRVVAPAVHAGRAFLCVDTGGFAAEPPRDPAALAARVRAQTLAAVAEADCVVCVLDGPAGLAPEDRETV